MINYLREYEKEIGAAAAIASTIGIFLAAIGLLGTKAQIEDSRRAVEATTVYNMQKDAREVLKELNQTPQVRDYIIGASNNLGDPPAQAESKITEIIQFYSAVYNQYRDGIITEKYWTTFENEICGFVQFPAVAKFWKEKVVPGKYGDGFKKLGSKCLESAKSPAP